MPNKYVTHLVKHIGIRSLELFIGSGEQDKKISNKYDLNLDEPNLIPNNAQWTFLDRSNASSPGTIHFPKYHRKI